MYLKANKRYQLILAVTLLVTVIMGILIIVCPPALFPDPGSGFQVMRAMLMGGGFNLSITPDQADLTRNTSVFLTWWSPGQYLLPYCFKMRLGVNMGQSAAITVLFCDVLGILGFYSFFKKIGFSEKIATLSIVFIASQQYFVIPYIFYNGGETLLFGFLGWFLYGCFSFNKINWQLFVFVVLTGWIGFFCKSAFLWMYAAGMLCLWINLSSDKKEVLHWIKKGIILAIPTVISLSFIYKFYLSKGTNPTAASLGFHVSLAAFTFPFSSPLLSGFSIDELLGGLIFHQDETWLNPTLALIILVLLTVISIWIFAMIIRRVPNPKYKVAVSAFYAIAIIFFMQAFLRRLNISYEGRHFRIVGLLFVPGVIYLISKLKPNVRVVFIVLWIGIALSSVKYFVSGYKFNTTKSAHGPSGFSQQFIDQPSLNYLQALDKAHPNTALFAFTSGDAGLDIMHNRVISMDPFEDISVTTYIDNNEYDGRSGPLYVLLPAAYAKNGNVGMFEKCFPQYSGFTVQQLSKDYILLSAH